MKGFYIEAGGQGYFYPTHRQYMTNKLWTHLKEIVPYCGKIDTVRRAKFVRIILGENQYMFDAEISQCVTYQVRVYAENVLKGDNF